MRDHKTEKINRHNKQTTNFSIANFLPANAKVRLINKNHQKLLFLIEG